MRMARTRTESHPDARKPFRVGSRGAGFALADQGAAGGHVSVEIVERAIQPERRFISSELRVLSGGRAGYSFLSDPSFPEGLCASEEGWKSAPMGGCR
jgi:hypothetical protein